MLDSLPGTVASWRTRTLRAIVRCVGMVAKAKAWRTADAERLDAVFIFPLGVSSTFGYITRAVCVVCITAVLATTAFGSGPRRSAGARGRTCTTCEREAFEEINLVVEMLVLKATDPKLPWRRAVLGVPPRLAVHQRH